MSAALLHRDLGRPDFQPSLLDELDEGDGSPLGRLADGLTRVPLSQGAWVDLRRGWLHHADALYERLLAEVPWRGERRPMYDRVIDVPRLLSFYREGERLPDPALDEVRAALNDHYRPELGGGFVSAGLCLYRDGRDSVAWHGDTVAREAGHADTMVAILSVGSPRALLLRPKHGGAAGLRYELGHGDLIIMGGSCQRTWEHAVPKTGRPVGPRVSIQFRPRWVH
jgi:alkylated DNA repair dioxygenase AlkB